MTYKDNVYTRSVPLYLPMSINAPVDYSQISTLGNINYIIREAVQFVNTWNLIFFVFIKNLLMFYFDVNLLLCLVKVGKLRS